VSQNKLNEESFDTFFEHLEILDTFTKDTNTTSDLIASRLPNIYLYFMDKTLENLQNSNVHVPIITLYKKDGTTLEELNTSRNYLISETYERMSDFCDEAENVSCSVLAYVQKAVKSSSLNPNALFSYAYHLDDYDEKSITLLEDALALISTSSELFRFNRDAIYNNLGYLIYTNSQTEKYDKALQYLEKAYKLNSDSVYSLATMSSIYRKQKAYGSAYKVMEHEAYQLLHANRTTLLDKEPNYWIFVRSLIQTSYEFKDYNTTLYVCDLYAKLKDTSYEKCHQYIKEIKSLPKPHTITPLYSFWKLYAQPETYTPKIEQTKLQVASCGTISSYKESLKQKSTSRIQANLLEKFQALYRPHKVPDTLKKLIVLEEALGADTYVTSFYLDPESRERFFDYTFSAEDQALNRKVAQHFLPLAHIDGTGGTVAFWLHEGNSTLLENAPIIMFGSEGQLGIVSKNLKDFLYMLSFGVETTDGTYAQFVSYAEEYYRRPKFMAYRKWLKETMQIEPVQNWKVWGTPKQIEKLQEEANTLYRKKFFAFLNQHLPHNETIVETLKQAKHLVTLQKEKQHLLGLLTSKQTAKTYYLLAKNETKLKRIGNASHKDVEAYYQKAFLLDEHNTTILNAWAKFVSHLEEKKDLTKPKELAHFHQALSHIYGDLNRTVKAEEHAHIAIDLYQKVASNATTTKEKITNYKEVATIYKKIGAPMTAIDYYQKMLDLLEKEQTWRKQYIYKDMAEVYEKEKHYHKSIDYYKQAIALMRNETRKARYYYYIAQHYKRVKERNLTLHYARKAYISSEVNSDLYFDSKKFIEEIKNIKMN
jgi:tetratricopeptide (TPR) repeat protein